MLHKNLLISITAIVTLTLTALLIWQCFWRDNFAIDSNFKDTKLVVLNGEKLKSTTKCFRVHERIVKKFNDVLVKMRESEKSIKSEYEKVKNDAKLSQKQKTKDLTKIEAKWSDMATKYNTEIREIQNMSLKVSEIVQSKLDSIIESIAKDSGIRAVINSGNKDYIHVFYNSKDIDITDFVIKRLDEELPDISLDKTKK